jgi:hypothetical protein
MGLARRAGLAVTRRLRARDARVEEAAGVGDDDLASGRGRGARLWLDVLGEQVERVVRLFEDSRFERRAGRVEAWLRRALGLPPRVDGRAEARAPTPAPRRVTARVAPPPLAPEAARALQAEVLAGRRRAHTQANSELERAKRTRQRAPSAASLSEHGDHGGHRGGARVGEGGEGAPGEETSR